MKTTFASEEPKRFFHRDYKNFPMKVLKMT